MQTAPENFEEPMHMAGPSFLSIGGFFKATPTIESGERFIFMEASNEARDLQNEVILQKALKESAEYFLRFGNIDLDHYTQIGKPNPKKGVAGIPNYELYEIGRPVDVRVDGKRTFVKAQINSGEGIAAEKANIFWSSITEVNPPKRWYPSVGGAVLSKSTAFDESTGAEYPVIDKVRWSNIGLSLTPVNADVPEVSMIPIEMLAKCWGPLGLDLRKSLTAGYNSDSATMTGGDALRAGNGSGKKQSDDGRLLVSDYFRDFRDPFAKLVHDGQAGRTPADMARCAAQNFALSPSEAARYVEMFFDDLKRSTKRGSQ